MNNVPPGCVYMLACKNDRLYIGSTRNLIKRFYQHYNGSEANFTRKHPPLEVVYLEFYPDVRYAFHREKQLQKWSRAKKEALIINAKLELQALSVCQNESHSDNIIRPSTPLETQISISLTNLERSRAVNGNPESRGE